MLKKLRWRFVLCTMLTFLAIFAFTCFAFNLSFRRNVSSTVSELTGRIISNNGEIPSFDIPAISSESRKKKSDADSTFTITSEMMQQIRFFTVYTAPNGSVIRSNTRHIREIEPEYVLELARIAMSSGKNAGRIDSFSYRIDNGIIVFVDVAFIESIYSRLLLLTISVSVTGLAFMFMVVLLTSKLAVKPFAESYEKQKRFITDAGHELKTPITIIDANAEILEMDIGENECVSEITNQTKRMTELTQRLIYMAKMSEGKYSPVKIDFLLSDMVSDVASEFSARFTTENKQLTTEITPLLSINGSENDLRHVISILLDNALKYSVSNSEVVLTLKPSGSKNMLTLSNQAENMSSAVTSHMFDRFYRGEASRNTETGGQGLGLSIAKDIVESSGGKISAHCKGNLLTISVSFPAVKM